MGFTKYVAALCCIVVLLVFLPVSDGWFEFTSYEPSKNRVGVLFGDDGGEEGNIGGDWNTLNGAFGESQTPAITDKDGNPIVAGEDPLAKLPAQGQYHAGISETAKKMNEEYLKLVQYYVAATEVPNKAAMVYYVLAASITEQGGINPEPNQIFVTSPFSTANYDKDPDCIKIGGFADRRDAAMWYQADIDPDWKDALGPLSVTDPALANPLYHATTPYYESLGTSIGTTPKRTSSAGVPGDKQNWYDAAQFTCGTAAFNWRKYSGNYDSRLGTTNPYYFIGWTSMMANIGESMANKAGDTKVTVHFESLTPNFAQELTAICSEKWVIDEIRDYVRKNKPPNYNWDEAVKTDLYIPLIKKIRIAAVERDPNFFSNERYSSTKENHFVDPAQGGFLDWGMGKATTALRTIICAIILEERYSGAY